MQKEKELTDILKRTHDLLLVAVILMGLFMFFLLLGIGSVYNVEMKGFNEVINLLRHMRVF